MPDSIQSLCAQGQEELLATHYLMAERLLAQAEQMAWDARDWDALARLYMPLQEARRQRRQRALEGAFITRIITENDPAPGDITSGQVLIAGKNSIAPAIALRQQVIEQDRYVDVFLAAAYRLGDEWVLIIAPTDLINMPADCHSIDSLLRQSPPHSVVLPASELPPPMDRMDASTGAFVMQLWETLHRPFLAAADACEDPMQRMAAYRQTIVVDYACELAHQKLSQTARELARVMRS